MRKEAEYGRVFTCPVTHVVPHSRIVAKKKSKFSDTRHSTKFHRNDRA